MDCAHQAPLAMGLSWQEYWHGLPFPPPEDLPDSRIKPMSLASPALAGRFFTTESPGKPTSSHAATKVLHAATKNEDPTGLN